MSCPFSKETARLARQQILEARRHIDLQGSNELGATNFDSRAQLILVAIGVASYLLLTVAIMLIFTRWKIDSRTTQVEKIRDVPPQDRLSGGVSVEYSVILLDKKPLPRLTKNLEETGVFNIEGDAIVIRQPKGRYSVRHEISRISEFQYWMNYACFVVEPYSFDPNVKVASYVKFDESGSSRQDFQNALMKKHPFGIVFREQTSVGALGSANLNVASFEVRRREVESVFAGAAIQAISASSALTDDRVSKKELEHLGFDLTNSFLDRAKLVAGGFTKGAVGGNESKQPEGGDRQGEIEPNSTGGGSPPICKRLSY